MRNAVVGGILRHNTICTIEEIFSVFCFSLNLIHHKIDLFWSPSLSCFQVVAFFFSTFLTKIFQATISSLEIQMATTMKTKHCV